MKSFLKQLVLSLIVVAAVVAVWIAYVPSSIPWLERAGVLDALGIEIAADQSGGESRSRFQRGAPQVVVAPVQIERQLDRVAAIGDGRAMRSVTVRAEVAGRVRALGVRSGQYVEAGSVVLQLDDGEERIALERAILLRTDARQEQERVLKLSDTGAVTAVRQQEARLDLENAELAVRQAEFDLTQKEIRAPISGYVGLLELEEGDRIAAQDPILLITDRSRILIDFRVPERVVAQVRLDMPFQAIPLALRDQVLSGKVTAVDNRVDRTSRTLRVRGVLDNDADVLRDGMAFSVAMDFEGRNYPSVPPLSVQWSSDGAFVWVLREGKAARVPIRIKQRNVDSVLVEADLTDGLPVVVEGVQSLRPGSEVDVTENLPRRPAEAMVQPAGEDPAKL